MTASVLATVGHGSTALWYLTRATGLVSLILLSATVVLGTVASVGWTSDRWPRFLSQSLHRNLSLFCIALIGVHIVTTVGDGYVPIGLADAFIPFRSPYRPIWVGLGAVAFDMLLAVAITERAAPPHRRGRLAGSPLAGLRLLADCRRPRPGLGLRRPASRGDDRVRPLYGRCRRRGGLATRSRVGALGDLAARLRRRRRCGAGGDHGLRCRRPAPARMVPSGRHLLRPSGPAVRLRLGVVLLCADVDHALDLRPARLRHPSLPPSIRPCRERSATSPPNSDGDAEVTLTMRLADTSVPLQVRIIGPAVNGGVALHHSEVTFGQLSGEVTALDGSTIGALVTGPTGSLNLTMNLSLNPGAGTLTGQLSGGAQ